MTGMPAFGPSYPDSVFVENHGAGEENAFVVGDQYRDLAQGGRC